MLIAPLTATPRPSNFALKHDVIAIRVPRPLQGGLIGLDKVIGMIFHRLQSRFADMLIEILSAVALATLAEITVYAGSQTSATGDETAWIITALASGTLHGSKEVFELIAGQAFAFPIGEDIDVNYRVELWLGIEGPLRRHADFIPEIELSALS